MRNWSSYCRKLPKQCKTSPEMNNAANSQLHKKRKHSPAEVYFIWDKNTADTFFFFTVMRNHKSVLQKAKNKYQVLHRLAGLISPPLQENEPIAAADHTGKTA